MEERSVYDYDQVSRAKEPIRLFGSRNLLFGIQVSWAKDSATVFSGELIIVFETSSAWQKGVLVNRQEVEPYRSSLTLYTL